MNDTGDVRNSQFNANYERWSNVHIQKPSKYANYRYESVTCSTMVTRNEREPNQN